MQLKLDWHPNAPVFQYMFPVHWKLLKTTLTIQDDKFREEGVVE